MEDEGPSVAKTCEAKKALRSQHYFETLVLLTYMKSIKKICTKTEDLAV